MGDSGFSEAGFTLVLRPAPEPSSPQALIRAQLALSRVLRHRFLAALVSRSCNAPHAHLHSRRDNGSSSTRTPHSEHILLLGNQRLAVTSSAPYSLALYLSWRQNSRKPMSAILRPVSPFPSCRARSNPRCPAPQTRAPTVWWSGATSPAERSRCVRASGPAAGPICVCCGCLSASGCATGKAFAVFPDEHPALSAQPAFLRSIASPPCSHRGQCLPLLGSRRQVRASLPRQEHRQTSDPRRAGPWWKALCR